VHCGLSLCSPEGWLSCALAVVLVIILLVLLLAVVLLALVVFLLIRLLILVLLLGDALILHVLRVRLLVLQRVASLIHAAAIAAALAGMPPGSLSR